MHSDIEREIKISTPLNSPAREFVLNLFRTEQVMRHALESALHPFDVRLDEFNVLRILKGAGAAGHERATIEERMVHDAERLLGLLHRLKQKGYVEGSLRLTITDAGTKFLDQASPVFQKALEDGVASVSTAEMEATSRVLERIRRAQQPNG